MIKLYDKKDCCGCEACVSACPQLCISMEEDKEGFLYPKINESICVGCGICERVCPILNHERNDKFVQKAFLVQNLDKQVLRESTSGGFFTAIADFVIESGGVVFGAEITEDYSVRHTSVEDKQQLYKFRNSKYVQSRIGDSYIKVREELSKGRMVCFSGTPCQIEGLLYFLKHRYNNLILVDVVCRAVPSPGIWQRFIKMESRQYGSIKSVRFRDKALGYQYSTMTIEDYKGRIYRDGIEAHLWLRMFFSGMIIRPSCSKCRFRDRYRNSDFTIWDCFNIYNLDRSFDENLGVTRVLIHTKKGESIFEHIKKKIRFKEIDSDIAVKGVKEMVESPVLPERREAFFKDLQERKFEIVVKKYFPTTCKIILKKRIRILLNALGVDKTIKHILKKG